jgi:hypothetical protein
MKKQITIEQYNKLMDRIITLDTKLTVQDKLIKMLEEAGKYDIKREKRVGKKG